MAVCPGGTLIRPLIPGHHFWACPGRIRISRQRGALGGALGPGERGALGGALGPGEQGEAKWAFFLSPRPYLVSHAHTVRRSRAQSAERENTRKAKGAHDRKSLRGALGAH